MNRIGLDFGTTNSILSYHDAETGTLRCFHHAAGDTDYVPTVIAYETRKGVPVMQIGKAARLKGDGGENVCGRFKLRLGKCFDDKLPGKQKTAHEAARDYIRELLRAYTDTGSSIDGMVMTIPDAWFRDESNYTARENISTILSEIGFPKGKYTFQSEPVAAAAYFCRQWETKQNQPYNGKLLVIDYGGGTLDVTLCLVTEDGRKIRTLDYFGTGTEENGIGSGCAGSAFLSRVIDILCQENGITADERKLSFARTELEDFLINQKETVDELMEEYELSPEDSMDEALFQLSRLDDCDVFCRHLYQAFQDVNAPKLTEVIRQIDGADEYDLDTTKIIFVGGFSNFYCVESTVRRCFNSRAGSRDPRFPDILTNENKALAIAKGAALLADGITVVESVFPYEVGIIVSCPDCEQPENLTDLYLPLIRKNDKTDEYASPVFLPEKLSVLPHAGLYVRMYRKAGAKTTVFRMHNQRDLQQIFPQSEEPQVFQAGISVDEDMIPTLYTKDESGTIRSTSLNKLLECLDVQLENGGENT